MRRSLVSALVLVVVLVLGSAVAADGGRAALAFDDMLSARDVGLVANGAFLPGPAAKPAREEFVGALVVAEAPMTADPAALGETPALGKNPSVFPGVALAFVTVGDDLVPAVRDVVRSGSTGDGESFWDVIVQPGKIWSEPDDRGWSRASFPFALVHSLEGETHNGVAMFLYKGGLVSNLRFQIVQQTSPFYIETYFTARGSLKAAYDVAPPPGAAAVARRHKADLADAVVFAPWDKLPVKDAALDAFDSDLKPGERVAAGVDFRGVFYLKHAPSAAGPLPYLERQRFGVWSITKSTMAALALLRLAEKYGEDVFDRRLLEYIPEAKGCAGWSDVTFGNALDMATGLGGGSVVMRPNVIGDGSVDDDYYPWYEARSVADKIAAMLEVNKAYPWGPGRVARYRDPDFFILGVAMTRFLREREGPRANILTMLLDEVYRPIGIHHAPTNRTIEKDPGLDQPLMAFGFYPTIGDLVKIARLYHNGGKAGGKQILHAGRLASIMNYARPRGLETGDPHFPRYQKAFWYGQYETKTGDFVYYPCMTGWGKKYVALFPDGITAVRLAKNWDGADDAAETRTLIQAAEALRRAE